MMTPVEEEECTGSPLSPVERNVRQEAAIRSGNQESSLFYQEDNFKPDPLWKRFIKSSTCHAMIFILFFIITVPTLIFLFVIENDPPLRLGISSCSVEAGYRVSCGHMNISRSYCLNIRCCHDEVSNECYHYIPSKYGYSTGKQNEVSPGNSGSTGGRFLATPKYTTLATLSAEELVVTVQEIDGDRVKVILHQPTDIVEEITTTEPKGYVVGKYEDFLAIEIHRSEAPQDLLLTTVLGPLMASEHYWEWTFQMTSTYLFGMGGLLIEPDTVVNQTFYANRYNHILDQPMFLAHSRGQWHSVMVDWVGGPLEVTILPSRMVILRMVGGGRIELTLGVGPDPRKATSQMRFTGENMVVPPKWMLGLHMCRDGVTTLQEALKEYINFHLKEKRTLKFATDCIHENLFLMLANDDPEAIIMTEFEEAVKRISHNILLSIPAQIPIGSTLFNEASAMDILYKNDTDNEYINASYNGLQVAFPNYEAEFISTYMPHVQKIIDAISVRGPILGLILRDNWPHAENIHFEDEEKFPYMTEGLTEALSYTLPYNASLTDRPTPHYLSHRSYSTAHLSFIRTLTVSNTAPDQQLIYITPTAPSRSPDLYAHLQHVNATWTDLRRVLHYSLYHSMFGVGGTGLVTAPVCGSGALWNDELQEELCTRWWLFAVTTPLVRVSSGGLRRDPESLPSKTSQSAVIRALRHRTALLPYYYTTLVQGEPLLRPVFYDYPTDNNTYALNEQYLVGDALLVAQPLTPNMVVQRVYLPRREECGGWYEYWGGKLYDNVTVTGKASKQTEVINEEGQWIDLPIIASDWVMFIASGKIIPRVKESSEDTFNLLIASGKQSCPLITGEMYFTKQFLRFEADQTKLTISNILAVKEETCGTDGGTKGFHIIENIYVYSRLKTDMQLILVRTDLCDEHVEDTLVININNGPPIIAP